MASVKIRATDPSVKPALRFNYLSTDQDRREWVEAIRVARAILNQPAFAPFNGGETSPGPTVETPEPESLAVNSTERLRDLLRLPVTVVVMSALGADGSTVKVTALE